MELRDLYNEKKERTGKTIQKGEPTPEGYFILIVVAVIQNKKGEFLIQKRSKEKGGEWALTGGHAKTKETSLEAVFTEVKEELGVSLKNPILFKEAQAEGVFCDLYYDQEDIDLKDLILQKEEVEDAKYASIHEIETLYQKGLFKKGHYRMFQDCLTYLKERL